MRTGRTDVGTVPMEIEGDWDGERRAEDKVSPTRGLDVSGKVIRRSTMKHDDGPDALPFVMLRDARTYRVRSTAWSGG